MARRHTIGLLAGLAALVCPLPALADVKDGVDAWSRGEWDAAVSEWRAPAQAGDPDALFNMGQAYRLGRGVPQNQDTAESYYLRAAKAGHSRAADTYGLLLFQDRRREEALPYIKDAADRGDPRAQYLLGIARFNGDIIDKDWVQAYALLILANGEGLPQAAPALAEMDSHIPLEQRQQAASLALTMRQEAEATRAREMTAAEFALDDGQRPVAVTQSATSAPAPAPQQVARTEQTSTSRVPMPIASVEIEPSVLAAQAAVHEALVATGTEDPAVAGADFARPANAALPQQAAVTQAPPPAPQAQPVAVAAPVRRQAAPEQAASASGPWKVQLGAFSVSGSAERLWASLSGRSELRGRNRLLVPAGRLTKLQAGGYASRGEAQAACDSLQRAGQACLVTQ